MAGLLADKISAQGVDPASVNYGFVVNPDALPEAQGVFVQSSPVPRRYPAPGSPESVEVARATTFVRVV